jgi:hypothetical protein
VNVEFARKEESWLCAMAVITTADVVTCITCIALAEPWFLQVKECFHAFQCSRISLNRLFSTDIPGDWICTACANDTGLNVGIEGHEYVEEVGASSKIKPLVIKDSDDSDDEIFSFCKAKWIKRKILHTSDSDSDSASEDSASGTLQKRLRIKWDFLRVKVSNIFHLSSDKSTAPRTCHLGALMVDETNDRIPDILGGLCDMIVWRRLKEASISTHTSSLPKLAVINPEIVTWN